MRRIDSGDTQIGHQKGTTGREKKGEKQGRHLGYEDTYQKGPLRHTGRKGIGGVEQDPEGGRILHRQDCGERDHTQEQGKETYIEIDDKGQQDLSIRTWNREVSLSAEENPLSSLIELFPEMSIVYISEPF